MLLKSFPTDRLDMLIWVGSGKSKSSTYIPILFISENVMLLTCMVVLYPALSIKVTTETTQALCLTFRATNSPESNAPVSESIVMNLFIPRSIPQLKVAR